jgi:hypothetical protein
MMGDELERMWKEAVVASFKVQLGDQELASGDWREAEVLFPL